MAQIKVTVVQSDPVFLNRELNLRKMDGFLTRIQSDLVVFPELCTSGYHFRSQRDLKHVAEGGQNGPTRRLLEKWARGKKMAIVAGFPEVRGKRFYNSALIVTPRLTQVYRKIHLFSDEKKFFSPGTQPPPVFTHNETRIGVMICFDWIFPEMARTLALNGADIVAHPSNLVLPYAQKGMEIRSLENHVFSITANRVGRERDLKFTGRSQILGTRGEILVRFNSTDVKSQTVRIHPDRSRHKRLNRKNHLLNDRRPALYRA